MNQAIQKHSTNNTKHSKYKYTYYQSTHTLQNQLNNHSTRYTPNEIVTIQRITYSVRSP